MNRSVIIQARMSSTRLPGKVLMPLAGKPVLDHLVSRVKAAKRVDQIVIATSTLAADDSIEDYCNCVGVVCVRGSESDVLDRYLLALRRNPADLVVRITADCPLMDPFLIDELLETIEAANGAVDYLSNILAPRTIPHGLDVEVFRREALERAGREAVRPEEREHVTPYIYHHPELFHIARADLPQDISRYRWTLDTPQDFEFLGKVFGELRPGAFRWQDTLAVMEKYPEWVVINAAVPQKSLKSQDE